MPNDTTWPDKSPATLLYLVEAPTPALPDTDRWPRSETPTGAAAGAVVAFAALALMLGCLFGLPLVWALFWATP